jgi:hypothetical protein
MYLTCMCTASISEVLIKEIYWSPKPPQPKEEEKAWSDEPSDVVHLTDDNFSTFMAENPSVLVMFYAPCKSRFYSILLGWE